MNTDYTLNRVKLSNGKRLEMITDDFIKHFNGYQTIDDEKTEQPSVHSLEKTNTD